MKKKIHFIINSRSEHAIAELTKELNAHPFWNDTYTLLLWKSLYKGHALELTQKAIQDGTSSIVACGGDGTINEIARFLLNTDISLGIIPLGSGNGVARHFKIPLNIKGSLAVIREQHTVGVDAGLANHNFFLSNMGVSFDATFINAYQNIPSRGFLSYFKALFLAFKEYKNQKFIIQYADVQREVSPFLLMISNINQFGYDFSLSRKSLASDGVFELILFKKNSVWALFKLFLASRFGLILSENLLEIIPVSELTIESKNKESLIQQDGEINQTASHKIDIKMHHKGLNVFTPDK